MKDKSYIVNAVSNLNYGQKVLCSEMQSGYKGKSKGGISMHKFRAEWKSNFPRGDWKVTDQTCICSKHFTASDFITERRDSNTTRSTKKKDTELKYRFLKDDAYPTIYSNCTQYLSQKKPASRPSLGSTAAREFTIAKREEEKKALELEKDSVKSINGVKDKLRVQEYINSPSMKNASIKIETSQVVFYELDVRVIKPSVKYCVIIYEDMTYRIWYYDIMISPETVSEIGNVLGNNTEIRMILDGIATEDCQYFLDLVNRGGLMKPSDIVFAVCCVAWEVYVRIMESYDAKSYFLACKMQRKVFINSMLIETRSHYTYSSILETSCLQDHPFENIFVNIVTKLFNKILRQK